MLSNTTGQLGKVNDPRLAALERLYGKMRGARNNPGTVYVVSAEDDLAAELVEHARREGFIVGCHPAPQLGRKAVSVTWPAKGRA